MLSHYHDLKMIKEFQAQQWMLEVMLAIVENNETQKDAIDSDLDIIPVTQLTIIYWMYT